MPSRSNEKERSELKGGFRGNVNMKGGSRHHYIKGKKRPSHEGKPYFMHCLTLKITSSCNP